MSLVGLQPFSSHPNWFLSALLQTFCFRLICIFFCKIYLSILTVSCLLGIKPLYLIIAIRYFINWTNVMWLLSILSCLHKKTCCIFWSWNGCCILCCSKYWFLVPLTWNESKRNVCMSRKREVTGKAMKLGSKILYKLWPKVNTEMKQKLTKQWKKCQKHKKQYSNQWMWCAAPICLFKCTIITYAGLNTQQLLTPDFFL